MGNACQRQSSAPVGLTSTDTPQAAASGSFSRGATDNDEKGRRLSEWTGGRRKISGCRSSASRCSYPLSSSRAVAESSSGRSPDSSAEREADSAVELTDGITSLTVEHSSTSGYPTSLATISVHSDATRTCSPLSKSRSCADGGESTGSAQGSATGGASVADGRRASEAASPSCTSASKSAAAMVIQPSLSAASLEPEDQHRLRNFYTRNLRAQKRHATVIEQQQQRLSLTSCETSSTASERVNLYDVFSPDERSTRWSEFQELLASSKQEEYTSYKTATRNIRGTGKAMTIAGVRPNPNPAGQLPIIH